METADRLAILDVLDRYGQLYDGGDFNALADLFTADARFELRGQVGSVPGVMTGAQEIVGVMRARRQELVAVQSRHIITNIVITALREKMATTRCYLVNTRTTAGGASQVVATGTYDDQLQRHLDGTWRIAHRVLTLDSPLA